MKQSLLLTPDVTFPGRHARLCRAILVSAWMLSPVNEDTNQQLFPYLMIMVREIH
ncbi:MAG: hypothetical protein R3C11_16875 [Planctomycetaceae bacterium]